MLYAQNLGSRYFKAKIATSSRDLSLDLVLNLVRVFYKGADTAGAHGLAYRPSVLINSNLLKVWLVFSFGCPHRVASIMAEGGLLSTFLADRHDFVLSKL